jgi:hypothetical protein
MAGGRSPPTQSTEAQQQQQTTEQRGQAVFQLPGRISDAHRRHADGAGHADQYGAGPTVPNRPGRTDPLGLVLKTLKLVIYLF